jgi:AraC-like DNA-binding protein
MDETLAEIRSDALRDGFAGQRLLVVPRPTVRRGLQQLMTDQLIVTDAGFFPHAERHGRSRPDGGAENIVLLCTDGNGWVRVGDARVTVLAGDAVVVPARTAHEYAAALDDPWTLWWFHFVGAYASSAVEAARAAAGGPVTHLRDAAPVASLISQVMDGLDAGTTGGQVRSTGAAWHALTHLIATGRRPASRSMTPLERAVEHLRATAPHRTPLHELAAMVGLSTSQLGARFRDELGVSPLQYQLQMRMAHARVLLDTTDLAVAAVARGCGYDDALYFTRQFTRTHGTPPSAFRERTR